LPLYTQADLDALTSAIKQGVKVVKYGDKHVEYRDLSEMLQLQRLMLEALGLRRKEQKTFPTFSKGF
jgi:hypothetical protein